MGRLQVIMIGPIAQLVKCAIRGARSLISINLSIRDHRVSRLMELALQC